MVTAVRRATFHPRRAGARRSHIRPRTLLIGCSFAGLEFLYRYVRQRGRLAAGEITVVDPRAQHEYIPLLHEAVSGARTADALRFDTSAFCEAVGASFITSTALDIVADERLLVIDGGEPLRYDRLIVAAGSVPTVPVGITCAVHVVTPKWLPDALRLRDVLHALHADGAPGAGVVVVGAGITGVEWGAELAGAVVAGRRVSVTIVGKDADLLPAFRRGPAAHAARVLDRLGVRTVLGRAVSAIEVDRVVLDDGSTLRADAVVWAGGLSPAPLLRTLRLPLTEGGHLAVTPRLAVPGIEWVYGIGDAVRVVENGSVWPTMERAIESIWQGALLARRMAHGWDASDGPAHRLRRDFPYGLSLGPRNSMIIYDRWWADAPVLAPFRRWLQWAYYARYRAVATLLSRGGPSLRAAHRGKGRRTVEPSALTDRTRPKP